MNKTKLEKLSELAINLKNQKNRKDRLASKLHKHHMKAKRVERELEKTIVKIEGLENKIINLTDDDSKIIVN